MSTDVRDYNKRDQEQRVVVVRFDVPLLDIFVLLVKIAIASIPLYLLAWLILKQF